MHWIKAYYFDHQSPDVFTHHSTYRDNRFIDTAYHARMERRKQLDPDGYRVYGLGEWGELGGLILTNFEVHDFPISREYFDGMYVRYIIQQNDTIHTITSSCRRGNGVHYQINEQNKVEEVVV